MYLINVIPLSFIPKKESQVLTYFFKTEIKKGSLVSIPLRNKKQLAIVIGSEEVKKNKLLLKESLFSIKPISTIKLKQFFPNYIFKLSKWLSEFYICPLSLVFFNIFPKQEKFYTYLDDSNLSLKVKDKQSPLFSNKNIFPFTEEIKKITKSNKQILIIVPNKIVGKIIYFQLKKDFQEIVSYWQKTDKQKAAIWQLVFKNKLKIIIGLQRSLFLPFKNLGLIIIFDSLNKQHKNNETYPYFDNRIIAKKLAKLNKTKIINYSLENDCLKNKTEIKIANLKEEKFNTIISSKIEDLLKEKNKKYLFYTNRKGYDRYIICKDCKHTINCPNCSVPLTLHKDSQNKPYLVCHHCGYKQKVPEKCPFCGGYMLEGKGVGSQKIAEMLPKNKTIIFDIDNLKNQKQEEEIIKKIISEKEVYVVATETILKWLFFLKGFFDYTIISSADSLLSFPYFDTSENFLLQLERLKYISKNIYIQTFNPNLPIFNSSESLISRLKKEDKIRKKFGFPPTKLSLLGNEKTKMVKITVSKKDKITAKNQSILAKKALEKKGLDVLGPSQSFIFKKNNFYRYELLIRLKKESEKNIIKETIPLKDWLVEIL